MNVFALVFCLSLGIFDFQDSVDIPEARGAFACYGASQQSKFFSAEILSMAIQQLAMQPPAAHPNWVPVESDVLCSLDANSLPASLLGSVGQLGQSRNDL